VGRTPLIETNADLPPAQEKSLPFDPETARIIRLYLERVALRIERMAANRTYTNALKIAARMVRDSKPD